MPKPEPFNLRDWQARMKFTQEVASAKLGMHRATYCRYLDRDVLPDWLVLACKALESGIEK